MKKVIAAIALVATAILAQSCGGGEKCPAYSQAESAEGQAKL